MKEFTMTSFIHIDIPTRHAGAERLEAAAQAAQHLRSQATGARGLATLLLSAVAAAVMVAAYQVMDSVAEGQLLVIWIALWAVAFATLALFASSARNLAARMKASADAWSRAVAEAKSDQRLWAAAKKDDRIMSDLHAAMSRSEQELDEPVAVRFAAKVAAKVATAPTSPALQNPQKTSLRAYQQLYI
jgi:hypothetical protein